MDLSRDHDDPKQILADTCSIGSEVHSVSGTLSLKAESPEASGQFPAFVEAAANPESLKLEVVNLLGATEAVLRVQDGRYEVLLPKGKRRRGVDTWGGIPLRWALALVLGRFPCPRDVADAEPVIRDDGSLEVSEAQERFVYHFGKSAGKPWPQQLEWEKAGDAAVSVIFRFDEPDGASSVPLRWEAKSARGLVKVRWKKRMTQSEQLSR